LILAALLVAFPASWIIASQGIIGDVEFGYYKGFNVARHAIERSGCAKLVEYSGVNKDLFLEEFHFKVTTTSGRIVRLWFDASNEDVRQLCYQPKGLLVLAPGFKSHRSYTIEALSRLLNDRGHQVRDVRDILCNIDELKELLKSDNSVASATFEGGSRLWDFVWIDFPTQEDLHSYRYTNIREQDVTDWP